MSTTTTCKRHPDTETRLACSNCGDPICPRCAVPGHVGQKCPDCARQARGARRRGKPRQYAKGAAAGLAAAIGAGAGLYVLLFLVGIPFLGWIATGFAGWAVGRAVRAGAEGNGADPFRNLAIGLAIVMVVGLFVLATGTLLPGGGFFAIGAYLAAVYGAVTAFR